MAFPADARHLADVRRAVTEVGGPTSLDRYAMADFLTAVDEAVANAIRHGSPRGLQDTVHVVCAPADGGISVEVRDSGRGFVSPSTPSMPGPEATGGRGLPLMCALADRVEVASTPNGTRVTLSKAWTEK
jgi:anti-sigma regulatory factor (Ser/Thr protein kinase)